MSLALAFQSSLSLSRRVHALCRSQTTCPARPPRGALLASLPARVRRDDARRARLASLPPSRALQPCSRFPHVPDDLPSASSPRCAAELPSRHVSAATKRAEPVSPPSLRVAPFPPRSRALQGRMDWRLRSCLLLLGALRRRLALPHSSTFNAAFAPKAVVASLLLV